MKKISSSEIKSIDFFEVIIPFQGQLGFGGDLPNYLEQGNCDILPNKSGLLIQKEVFLELIDKTTILEDFKGLYFFKNPDSSETRYQMEYPIQETDTIQRVGVSYILVKKDYK